jgi:hypothetical protein
MDENCLLAIQCVKDNNTSECQRLSVTCQIGEDQWNCDFNKSDRDMVYLVYFMLDRMKLDIRAYTDAIITYNLESVKELQKKIRAKIINIQSLDTTNVSNASSNICTNFKVLTYFSHEIRFQIKPFVARPLSLFVKLICEKVFDLINADIFDLHSSGNWAKYLNFLSIINLLLEVSVEILFYEPGFNYSKEVIDLPSALCASKTLERHIKHTLLHICETRNCTYRNCVISRAFSSIFNYYT